MKYTFAIEKFDPIGENDCEIEVIHQEFELSLEQALDKVKEFVKEHPDGYLLDDRNHKIEYEIDGAELACWVDLDYYNK